VDAVRQALRTVKKRDEKPKIWLIAGGRDKGFDYDELVPELQSSVKGVFLLGETQEKILAAWGRFVPCIKVQTLLEAVNGAAKHAVPGDVVLLSPACSSFDMFQNYQHRGEVFREAVQSLPHKECPRD
jgi:UDP-N-acetylmuramoylalanine--D-glutamate ligase